MAAGDETARLTGDASGLLRTLQQAEQALSRFERVAQQFDAESNNTGNDRAIAAYQQMQSILRDLAEQYERVARARREFASTTDAPAPRGNTPGYQNAGGQYGPEISRLNTAAAQQLAALTTGATDRFGKEMGDRLRRTVSDVIGGINTGGRAAFENITRDLSDTFARRRQAEGTTQRPQNLAGASGLGGGAPSTQQTRELASAVRAGRDLTGLLDPGTNAETLHRIAQQHQRDVAASTQALREQNAAQERETQAQDRATAAGATSVRATREQQAAYAALRSELEQLTAARARLASLPAVKGEVFNPDGTQRAGTQISRLAGAAPTVERIASGRNAGRIDQQAAREQLEALRVRALNDLDQRIQRTTTDLSNFAPSVRAANDAAGVFDRTFRRVNDTTGYNTRTGGYERFERPEPGAPAQRFPVTDPVQVRALQEAFERRPAKLDLQDLRELRARAASSDPNIDRLRGSNQVYDRESQRAVNLRTGTVASGAETEAFLRRLDTAQRRLGAELAAPINRGIANELKNYRSGDTPGVNVQRAGAFTRLTNEAGQERLFRSSTDGSTARQLREGTPEYVAATKALNDAATADQQRQKATQLLADAERGAAEQLSRSIIRQGSDFFRLTANGTRAQPVDAYQAQTLARQQRRQADAEMLRNSSAVQRSGAFARINDASGSRTFRLTQDGKSATELQRDTPSYRAAEAALGKATRAHEEEAQAARLLADLERGLARRVSATTVAQNGKYYQFTNNGTRAQELTGFAQYNAGQQDPAQRGIVSNFLGGLTSRGFGGGTPGKIDLGGLAQAAGTTVKYTALYSALNLVQQSAADAAASLLNYEDSVAGLSLAYRDDAPVSQLFLNNLQDVAAAGGVNVGDVMDQAAVAMRAFGGATNASNQELNEFAVQFTSVASKLSLISGQDLTTVGNQLRAATSSLAGGDATTADASRAAGQYADAVSGAFQNVGGDFDDIADGYRAIATTAKQAGFSANETANIVAATTSRLGESGQLAGTRLQRVFAIIGGSEGQNALRKLNQTLAPEQQINLSSNTADQVRQLGQVYGSLNDRQRASLTNALGGTANTGELVVLLQNANQILEQNGESFDYAGKSAEEYNRRLNSLAGFLKQLQGNAEGVKTALSQTGIVGPLKAVAFVLLQITEATRQLLQGVNALTSGFGTIPDPVREIGATLLAVLATMRLIGAVQARGGLGAVVGRAERLASPERSLARDELRAREAAAAASGQATPLSNARTVAAAREREAARAAGGTTSSAALAQRQLEQRATFYNQRLERAQEAAKDADKAQQRAADRYRTFAQGGAPGAQSRAGTDEARRATQQAYTSLATRNAEQAAARQALERANADAARAQRQVDAGRRSSSVAANSVEARRAALDAARDRTLLAGADRRSAAAEVQGLRRAGVGAGESMTAAQERLRAATAAQTAALEAERAATQQLTAAQRAAAVGTVRGALSGGSDPRETARGVRASISSALAANRQGGLTLRESVSLARANAQMESSARSAAAGIGGLRTSINGFGAGLRGIGAGLRDYRGQLLTVGQAVNNFAASPAGQNARAQLASLKAGIGGFIGGIGGILIAIQLFTAALRAQKEYIQADTTTQETLSARPETNSEIDLKAFRDRQAQDLQAARDASTSVFGRIADAFGGGALSRGADDLEKALADTDASLKRAIQRTKANVASDRPTVDLSSTDNLTSSIQALQEGGRNATTIMNALSDSVANLANAANGTNRALTDAETKDVTQSAQAIAGEALRGQATDIANSRNPLINAIVNSPYGIGKNLFGGRLPENKIRNITDSQTERLNTGVAAATESVLAQNVDLNSARGKQILTNELNANLDTLFSQLGLDREGIDATVQDITNRIAQKAQDVRASGGEQTLKDDPQLAAAVASAYVTQAQASGQRAALAFANTRPTRATNQTADEVGAKATLDSLNSMRQQLVAAGATSEQLEQYDDAIAQATRELNDKTIAGMQLVAALNAASIPSTDQVGQLDAQINALRQQYAAATDNGTRMQLQTQAIQAAQQRYVANQQAGQAQDLANQGLYDLVGQADAQQRAADQNLRRIQQGFTLDVNGQRVAISGDRRSEAEAQARTAAQKAAEDARAARRTRDAALARQNIDPRDTIGNAQQDVSDLQREYDELPVTAIQQRAQIYRQIAEKTQSINDALREQARQIARAAIDPRDTVGNLNQDITDLQAQLAALPNTPNFAGQRAEIARSIVAKQQDRDAANRARDTSRALSALPVGDTVGTAVENLNAAQRELDASLRDSKEYFDALRDLNEKKLELAKAEAARAAITAKLGIDITNSVDSARADYQAAVDALNRIAASGVASQDEINQAQSAVNQAKASQQQAEFQEALYQIDTAKNLDRITHAEAMKRYETLRAQLAAQLAGMKSTDTAYSQIQKEIDQIDQVLKAAKEEVNQAFNLQNVTLPTLYEVRRAVGAQVDQVRSQVVDYSKTQGTVIINGADMNSVIAYINKTLGTGSTSVYTTSPRRV